MDSKVMKAVTQIRPGEKAALATIIATTGSSPRKAGAQAIFFSDGRSIGTIGGGTVEALAKKHAGDIMRSGQPAVVRVNLTNDIAGQDGMICGGLMDIFIEPLGNEYR